MRTATKRPEEAAMRPRMAFLKSSSSAKGASNTSGIIIASFSVAGAREEERRARSSAMEPMKLPGAIPTSLWSSTCARRNTADAAESSTRSRPRHMERGEVRALCGMKFFGARAPYIKLTTATDPKPRSDTAANLNRNMSCNMLKRIGAAGCARYATEHPTADKRTVDKETSRSVATMLPWEVANLSAESCSEEDTSFSIWQIDRKPRTG
mmetsp:Transcript_25209/g.43525  ORF Transcript_25209/g.43525 Transcript_25209/m.43525 type:complete len:210 (-) Transcript_25209:276-905(-)